MKTILINEGCPNPVALGEKGENGVSSVLFDYSEWISDFGDGAISLLVKRKGDTAAYPVVLSTADGIATWTISDTDTAVQGYGKAEYVFTIDDKIAKSAVFSFYVAADLGPAGDPPDPYESWIDTLTELGGETLINAQAAQAAQTAAETAQASAETAATNAATSATAAAQSAGAARFAAESALASSDSASASATAASGHATAASASATQAAASASAAEASETAAYDSANTAAEEAELAQTAATTATTAANNASASASSASASATAASGSASSASASATTATQAASSATQSANNASQSASAASGSATQAASSASSAAASAERAETAAASVSAIQLPVDTASGSIASFPDGASGVPVEALTISLEPIQSGSGTPSPDNVRPITGYSEVEVWRTGKNLLPNVNVQDTASRVRLGESSVGDGNLFKAGTYRISYAFKDGTTPQTPYWRTYKNGVNGAVNNAWIITLTEDTNVKIWLYNSNGVALDNVDWAMVELGSTATDFEPYSGQTVEVNLDGERYGGTLDVLNGVLTVDRAGTTIDALSWTYNATYRRMESMSVAGVIKAPLSNGTVLGGLMSSVYTPRPAMNTGSSPINGSIGVPVQKALLVLDEAYTDVTSWLTDMGQQQVVYPLAEPITIQLTPAQVTALLGQNNIWSDAGDVDVTYRADIQKYIAKVISEALA